MSLAVSPIAPIAAVPRAPLSIAIGPWRTGPVQEVGEFDQGSLSLTLNDGHQCTFSMPGRSPAARLSDGLTTDVWLYVDDRLAGRLRMLPLSQSWGPSGEDFVAVTAVSYKRLLAWRYLHAPAPAFTQVEQGDIVWALINHAQQQSGGSLGLTKGTTATGVKRDRTDYKVGDNVLDLGLNMSGVENGCWWDVDQDGLFTAKLYSAFPIHPTPLVLGSNALTLARVPTPTFANAAMASGSDEQTVPVWAQSAGVAADPRGRWEATTSSPETIVQATLTEHARGLLDRSMRPPSVWTADIEPYRWRTDSAYRPGDRVTVIVPADTADVIGPPAGQVVAQVTEVAASFDGHGVLTISVTATEGLAAVPTMEATT
jgi:hypothetical protein